MLNFSPDHLDRHPTVEAYAAAKARIFENQDAGRLGGDQRRRSGGAGAGAARPRAAAAVRATRRRSTTGRSSKTGWIVDRTARSRASGWCRSSAIHLLGPHLVNDVMAAATVGAIAGAAPAAMTAAVDAFRGLEHAMELVAEVGGVRFVNDSKATNVESALRSIESFERGLVPIIGGRFKGGDLRLLREPLQARAQGGRRDRRGADRWCARRSATSCRCTRRTSFDDAVDARVRAGAAVRRGAAGAGVRELRHVSRLRGARTAVQGRGERLTGTARAGCRERERAGQPSV